MPPASCSSQPWGCRPTSTTQTPASGCCATDPTRKPQRPDPSTVALASDDELDEYEERFEGLRRPTAGTRRSSPYGSIDADQAVKNAHCLTASSAADRRGTSLTNRLRPVRFGGVIRFGGSRPTDMARPTIRGQLP